MNLKNMVMQKKSDTQSTYYMILFILNSRTDKTKMYETQRAVEDGD